MEDIYIVYSLERTYIQTESPWEGKDIKPVRPKGNQPWIFIGRTDAEAEAPIVWPPDAKSWFVGKDPVAGKDWRQKEKGTTEDEMVGCITNSMDLSLCKLREIVKDKGSLVCCSPWGCKKSDTTEWPNNNSDHIKNSIRENLNSKWAKD